MAGGLIGALRVTLGIDTAAFEAGSARARKTAVNDANAIAKAYGGMRTAVTGLMAGISLGSIVAVTQRALEYASSLAEVAQQLGVTTKDLQEYRYAASQVGISQEEMDKGLAKLTVTMGKARDGAKEPVAAFKALSDILGKDILKNAATAGDAIPLIADALAKVKDPAARAAAEVALFGKTGQKLDTLLAGGSTAVNELRDAAQSLGLVLSEDEIANADKTADKLTELKLVLEANIASAVARNAGAIYDFVDSLERLISKIPDAVRGLQSIKLQLAVAESNLAQANPFLSGQAKFEAQTRGAVARYQLAKNKVAGQLANAPAGTRNAILKFLGPDAAAKLGMSAPGKPVDRTAASKGAGAGSSGAAKPKKAPSGPRVNPDKQAERYDREMASLADEQMRLEADLTNSTAERSAYAQKRVDADLAAYKTELDSKVKLGEITAEQAKKLALAKAFNAGLEHDVERQKAEDDLTREGLDTRNASLELQSDLVRGELSEAKTQAERRTLQQQLLDIEYDRQKAALEAVLALNSSTQAEKDIAQARLNQLGALKAHDAEGVRRDTAGPMETFRDSLHRSAGQIQEDFEQIQVDGIQTLNDGLVDAITNSKSLGDVFKNVANQIIGDLIRIALREAESKIFGGGSAGAGGGGGIGGLLGGIGKIFGGGSTSGPSGMGGIPIGDIFNSGGIIKNFGGLPGLAKGGIISGFGGIDTNLLSINGMPTARVNRGESIRIDPRDAGSDRQRVEIIPSPWFDVRAASAAEPSIQSMGVRAATGGSSMAQRSLGRQARQRLGRAG